MAKHPAWLFGLGLGDHISALRKRHVEVLACKDIATAVRDKFGDCTTIFPNPQSMDQYPKACICNFGICSRSPFFEVASTLSQQFQSELQRLKQLDASSYRAFSFTASVNSAASSSSTVSHANFLTEWIMVGCFCKRPIVQTFMRFQEAHGILKVKLEDDKPDIVTSHQLFSEYCLQLQRFFSADSIRTNLLIEVEAFEYDTCLSFRAHFEERNTPKIQIVQGSIVGKV